VTVLKQRLITVTLWHQVRQQSSATGLSMTSMTSAGCQPMAYNCTASLFLILRLSNCVTTIVVSTLFE